MNNKLPVFIATFFALVLAAVRPVSHAYAAPSIQFSPASASVAVNTNVTVTITVNAETNTVMGSDVTINYAPSDLTFMSAQNGGFFPEFNSSNNAATGRLVVHGYTSAPYDGRTGTGTLATVTFKAKQGTGSSALSFACTGGGNDTNIITTDGRNILNCAQVNIVSLTYTGGTVPTGSLTPTPSLPPGTSPTLTPTPSPVPGTNTIPVCVMLANDISTAIGAPVTVQFTCTGVDTDGYINAAEFTFGDGTSQTVQQNVGGNGSITTKHSYTTVGTLGASCKVRDNNNVFSSVPGACQKVITIKPKPKTTPAVTALVTGKPVLPSPKPTTAVVQIVSVTPSPIQTPAPITEEPPATAPDNRIWWYVGGGLAVLLALILLRRRNPPFPHEDGKIPLASDFQPEQPPQQPLS